MRCSGHLLKSSKLVRSRKWRHVKKQKNLPRLEKPGDFPRLVYGLLVGCVDSWGMIPADGYTLRAELGPHDDDHPPEDYEKAVQVLTKSRLLQSWLHQGDPWLRVINHDKEQSRGISKRKAKPDVPIPELPATPRDFPQNTADEVDFEVEVEVEVEGKKRLTQHPIHRSKKQLQSLSNHHAKLFDREVIPVALDDHTKRIYKVLASKGYNYCLEVQEGHLKQARDDGKWTAWKDAYPMLRIDGRGKRQEPDYQWIENLHNAGKKTKKKEVVNLPYYKDFNHDTEVLIDKTYYPRKMIELMAVDIKELTKKRAKVDHEKQAIVERARKARPDWNWEL